MIFFVSFVAFVAFVSFVATRSWLLLLAIAR